MRVLQLIDSLNTGGAERMAVNLANALSQEIDESYLCATREEGVLKIELQPQVNYLFLKKRRSLDLKALFKLRRYVKSHSIEIIHAHTTSFFLACLLKLIRPGLKIIWHEHHGKRIHTSRGNNKLLYICSSLFHKIITVNEQLRDWCRKQLRTREVVYLANFIDFRSYENERHVSREKQIVCLANLRVPKDHLNLLQAFNLLSKEFSDWEMLLVGKDFSDSYAQVLKNYIGLNNLRDMVKVLGERSDVKNILQQASIGVLSSKSEGLPMALLEYGAAKLGVVVTDVGQCAKVVLGYGQVVPPENYKLLASALKVYMSNEEKRTFDAANFNENIKLDYSFTAILPKLLSVYKD